MIFGTLFLAKIVYAHVIGISPWCVSTSPMHFECFYETATDCEKYKKKLKDPFITYQCAERPTDPKIINAIDPKK